MVDADGMLSLQDMATHDNLPQNLDITYRLYTMFEEYYESRLNSTYDREDYADALVFEAFSHPMTMSVEYMVPRILQTIVSHEARMDNANRTMSEAYWDRGVAVLCDGGRAHWKKSRSGWW